MINSEWQQSERWSAKPPAGYVGRSSRAVKTHLKMAAHVWSRAVVHVNATSRRGINMALAKIVTTGLMLIVICASEADAAHKKVNAQCTALTSEYDDAGK